MTPDALDRFIREAATALDTDPSSVPPTEEGFSDLLARIVAGRDSWKKTAEEAIARAAWLDDKETAEASAKRLADLPAARSAARGDGRRDLWMEVVGAVAGPLNARPDDLLLAGPERGVSMLVETIHSAVAQRTSKPNNVYELGRREMLDDVAAELAPILDVKPEQIDSLDRLADLMRNWLTEQVDCSTPSARAIADECDAVRAMLLKKNAAYGDSALAPVRLFSKASPVEQILVRLDDKLSRLARGSAAGEDVVLDLIGYLVLLRIAQRREREEMLRMEVGT